MRLTDKNFRFWWHHQLLTSDLPDRGKLVALSIWEGVDGQTGISSTGGVESLMEDHGMARRTVSNWLDVLRTKGWIVMKSRGNRRLGKCSEYVLAVPNYLKDHVPEKWHINEQDQVQLSVDHVPLPTASCATSDIIMCSAGMHAYSSSNHSSKTTESHVRGEFDGLGSQSVVEATDKKPAVNKRTRTSSSTIPADFKVDGEMETWARKRAPDVLDLNLETEKFRNHHRAKETKNANWVPAWKNWILKAQGFAQEKSAKVPAAMGNGNGKQPWF